MVSFILFALSSSKKAAQICQPFPIIWEGLAHAQLQVNANCLLRQTYLPYQTRFAISQQSKCETFFTGSAHLSAAAVISSDEADTSCTLEEAFSTFSVCGSYSYLMRLSSVGNMVLLLVTLRSWRLNFQSYW